MFCQIEGGEVVKVIPRPTTIVVNGVTYPRQVFTDKAQLTSLGILPYQENTVDNRFYQRGSLSYKIGSDEVVGTYAKTDKDVATLKEKMIEQVKNRASKLLAPTDWMVLRATEGGTAIPDAIKAYRVAIREESNTKETAIGKLTTLAEVIAYQNCPYIETRKDNDGNEYESERHLDLSNHYFAEDPLAKDDPTFVSLVKK